MKIISRKCKLERSNEAFRFLDLPGEIRNQIYKHTVGLPKTIVIGDFRMPHEAFPEITLVSKRVRAEALAILFNGVTVCVPLNRYSALKSWLGRWNDGVSGHFRHIRIEDHQHYHLTRPRSHPFRCFSAINIDLLEQFEPATYDPDCRCQYCPASDKAVVRENDMLKTMPWINGSWQLTDLGLWRIFEMAAWEICDAELEAGRIGRLWWMATK